MADVVMMRDSRSGGGSARRVMISPPQGRAASAERLTPMPDYLRPVVRSAVTRWKKLHEDHMMEKLVMKRTGKKEHNKAVRQEAKNLARKIPMEVLARDWLCEQRATAETRAFMVDKLLPTLILGVEKLLVEVDKRGLSDTVESDPNFNPINYLARYLMRNNPRYSNFCEASPYVRGLRQVGEQLKKQLFDIEENKLARIKAEAKRKREERERSEEATRTEKHRRKVALRRQYSQWDVGVYPDGRVELALVQNGLLSFKELSESGSEEGEERAGACGFTQELEPTDDTGKTLLLNEFIAYLKQYVEEIPANVFDQFMLHLSRCAETYRVSAEREQRRVLLTQVFVLCDHTGVGLLDRHRVLNLFEMFYDRAREDIKEAFRNPREWPVVDVLEIDSFRYSDEQNLGDNDNSVDVAKETTDDVDVAKETTDVVDVAKETTESVDVAKETTQGEEPSTKAGEDKEEAANNPTAEEEAADADTTAEGGETGDATAAAESAKTAEIEKSDHDNTSDMAGKVQNETEAEGQNETQDERQNESAAETGTEAEKSKEVEEETEIEKECELDTEKVDTQPEIEEKEEEANTEDRENEGGDSKDEESEKEKEKSAEEEKERDEAAVETYGVVMTTTIPEEGEPELSGLTEDQGPPPPPRTGDRPPMTQQSRVSFADGTTFEREKTVMSTRGSRSQSQASAFDENTLNMSQFIQLTETFLSDEPHSDGFKQLVRWVREGYMETEEERANRLLKARKEVLSARRKALLNSLFEMWDNDGSGFLDVDEVETVMKKYKDGIEIDAVTKGKKDLRKKSRNHDNRLSKREFRDLVYKVVDNMAGGNEHFDYFIDFLFNSVERSYAERVRGEARKKWLQQIVQAGETSATNMDAIYRAVFQSLYKDAETHGNNKQISANIAMLEKNDVIPDRGDVMLRYVASTPEDAGFVLGKALFPDMRSISCVETGKPIHVPRVNAHGGVHFWNPERTPEEREGAFIVIPLKDRRKRVFGLIGIDTLNDPHSRSIFITHEIQFYQGVAKAFSIAYHQVDVRQKTMRISESAVSWIHRRSPNVQEITVYMVEPDNKGSDYVLRKMMVTGHKGNITKYRNPARLERRDNLFRDYLFKCVDNSESVTADAYAERHLAIPIRNNDGLAVTVIDISIGELKVLPRGENRELTKMLKLLQMAYREILTEATDGERTTLLEGKKVGDDNRTEILFDRLMLIELRGIMSKLDPKAYAELRSYHEPPKVIHQIVKAVLSVFSPDKATSGEFNSWANCKQYITPQLSQQIVAYDPTSDHTDDVPAELIQEYLQDVPHGQVNKHGSIPAQYLYNWVFVCVSLIEHTRSMTRHRNAELNAQNLYILQNLPPPNKKLKKNGAPVAPAAEDGAKEPAQGGAQTDDAAQPQTNIDGNNEACTDDTEAPPSGEEQGLVETSGGGENEAKAE